MAKLGLDMMKLGLGKARRERTPRKSKNNNASSAPSEGLSGGARDVASFEFQKRVARIDWRTLLAVDVDRVIREVDIDTLESVLDVVAFGDIQGEDTRNFTEANLVKIFRLAQLMVEYLLYVQDLLADHKSGLLQSRANLEQKNEKIRSRFYSQRDALLQIRQELRQAKKTLQTYEVMLKVQENNQTSQSNEPQVWHCPFCEKAFESSYYLNLHVARTHENKQGMTDDKIQALVSTAEAATAEKVKAEMSSAVQAEIQRLRERYQADFQRAETNSNTQVRTLQEDIKKSNNQLHEVQTRLEVLQAQIRSASSNNSRPGRLHSVEKSKEKHHGPNQERLHELESKFSGLERQVKTLGQENSRLLKELNVAYAEISDLQFAKRQSVFALETQVVDLRKENQHLKRNKSKVTNMAVQAGFMSIKPGHGLKNNKSKSSSQSSGNSSVICESRARSPPGSAEVRSKALEARDHDETSHIVAGPGHSYHEIPAPILAIIEAKEPGADVPDSQNLHKNLVQPPKSLSNPLLERRLSPLNQSLPRPQVSLPLKSKLNFSGGDMLTNMIEEKDEALRALARPKPGKQNLTKPISVQSEPREGESSPQAYSTPGKRALRFLTPEKLRVFYKQRPNSASAAKKIKLKLGGNDPVTVDEMRAKLEWEVAAAHDKQRRRQNAVRQLLSKEAGKEKLEEKKKGKRTKCEETGSFKPSKFVTSFESRAPPLPKNEELVNPSSTIYAVRKIVSNRADISQPNLCQALIPRNPRMQPFHSPAPYKPDPCYNSRAQVHPYLRRGMGNQPQTQPPPRTSFHMAVLSSNPAASSKTNPIFYNPIFMPPSKEHIIERLSAVTRELGKYFPVEMKSSVSENVKSGNVQPGLAEIETEEDEVENRITRSREDVEIPRLQRISENAAMDVGEAAHSTTMMPESETETETESHEGTEKDFGGQLRKELKRFGITSTTDGISDTTYKSISSALEMQRSVRMSQVHGEKRQIVENERHAVVWHTQVAVRDRDLVTAKSPFKVITDSGSDYSSRANASEDSQEESARSNESDESGSESREGEKKPGSPSEQSSVVSENSGDMQEAEVPYNTKRKNDVDWARHGRVPRPPSPDGRAQYVSRTRSWEPTVKNQHQSTANYNRDSASREGSAQSTAHAVNHSRQSEGEETETDFGLGDWESDEEKQR